MLLVPTISSHISFVKSYMLTPSLPSLTGSGESGKSTIVKTDENYSSERVLSGGAPQLPNDEFSRLGAGHRSRYEED